MPVTDKTLAATTGAWDEATAMAALHACRTQPDLAAAMAGELARLLPDASMALCLVSDGVAVQRVECRVAEGCPWQHGEEVDLCSWAEQGLRLPVAYREHELGTLVLDRNLAAEERAVIDALLAHYGVALVNLTLNAESRQATENYCASLQALEEGIVLFQEEDPRAVQARLLSLASTMLHATAAALYVLDEVGDIESDLTLEAALGMPETLLEGFRSVDGTPWPNGLIAQPAQLFERGQDGGLGGLDPAVLPPILENIVAMPLRYHGVTAGICILFNSTVDVANASDHIGRVQSLGQLGAALLHRLQLEALAAQSHAIERELEIAETIQKRLIPTVAPATDEYEFAWCSIAAQHIGGDYLDVVASDLGDIHCVVADVSGHGINSALLMSSFRSTYRGDAPWMEPADLAASLNTEVVHEVGATGMFITAVALRLERGSRQMSICSAGHNPVFIFRRATGNVETVDSHGPPLGFMGDAEFGEQTLPVAPGDIVLLYTDGVTEATDSELDMYGEDRLCELLRNLADASSDEIVQGVRSALAEFTGSDRYDDDVSILVIRTN